MADATLGRTTRTRRPWLPALLRTGAFLAAGICVLPMVAVLLSALLGGTETLRHLAETVLLRYTGATLALVALVSLGTVTIGTGTAWLVTMTRFPGVRLFEIALALPLAFPAYVLAYAYYGCS